MAGGIASSPFGLRPGIDDKTQDAKRQPQFSGGDLTPQNGRTYAKDGSYTDYGVGLDTELGIRDKYNAQAEGRMQASLSSIGGSAPHSAAPTAPTFDEAGARAAAFARAKDQAGQTARSSLAGLREAMAGRNMLGGGAEAAATAQVAGNAGSQVNEFTREQLMQDLNRSAQTSDRERAAGLTERGQDMASRTSLLGLMRASGRLY